jgi:uncharacterized membrane protein (UPF0127 family)
MKDDTGNGDPNSANKWWLLRAGEVLAAADVASTVAERTKGLLGKTGYDGALVIHHTSAVHSFGMKFAIDIAFLDRHLVVIDITELKPWRLTLPRIRSRSVLEAERGAFERWKLRVGDELELRSAN